MEKVINDITNMANAIIGRIIISTPGPDSPYYWSMIALLAGLLSLLVLWLFVRQYKARRAGRQSVRGEAEITLSDVAAQAAADAQAGSGVPDGETADGQARDKSSRPTDGFQFFKKRGKANTGEARTTDAEDDVFLLGLEQEMLATRQLYLDGLISKEVYVTETRALYDKAQTRMT